MSSANAPSSDRLPILRFLVLFAALLGAAVGLAALSPPVEGDASAWPPAVDTSISVPASTEPQAR
jgi:hypothetical protein